MKKPEIASKLARRSGVTRGEAADQLDKVVHRILTNLRKGHSAQFPGLGKFTPMPDGEIVFETEARKGGSDAKA